MASTSQDRLGTPLKSQLLAQQRRSMAPSPSPAPEGAGSETGSSRSPMKRFGSLNPETERRVEDGSNSNNNNNHTQMRVRIISDPSIQSAFKQEEDRELWELFHK